MDEVWRQAPCPALRRWLSPAPRWEVNAAAHCWAQRRGIREADWQALVDAGGPGPERIAIGSWGWPLWRSAVPLADGELWWLATEDPDTHATVSSTESLASVGDIGRVGFFERDLVTGEGHWDAEVYRIYGFDPAAGLPPRAAINERIHPEDRALIAPAEKVALSVAGRQEMHFRIVRPDGEVRHLHSMSTVRHAEDGGATRLIGVLIDDTEVVERERRLLEASTLLSRALDLAGVRVWTLDAATRQVSYFQAETALDSGATAGDTPLGRQQLGLSIEDARARVHPEDVSRITKAMEDALHSDRVIDNVARYAGPTGEWRKVLTRRVAQRAPDGSTASILGVSLDVTALESQRQRAMALQERSDALSSALGLGLFSRDMTTGETECNAQMYRLYGLSPNEGPPTVMEWMSRHVHPDDRERLTRERALCDEQWTRDYQSEFRIVMPDGRERWIFCWVRRDEIGGRRMVHGVHLDVTERRSTELALERERERARFAMDVAGIGIWERTLSDRVGHGWYWNDHMYRLRGLDPTDPRPIDELSRMSVHPDEEDRLQAEYKRHIATGRLFNIEHEVHLPDGTVRWLATRGRVLRDAAGTPVTMTGINIDITERKEAESLWLEHQRIEQASRAKSEFMARVSHELRTPMNAVLGFTQLLVRDPAEPPSPRQRERLNHIEVAGHHLLALIDDVLDLASIEAADRPLAQEAVSLEAVVGDTLEWVTAQAQRAGVSVRRGADVLAGQVLADRRRVGQIVANLLTNAVKYNRDGGWVRIDTRARPRAGGGTEWALVVRDSGRGFTPAQRQRLFEPFNRLGAERSGIQGTGIGLAIVRQLAERMGGSVEVDSEAGVGSEFRVWLPATELALADPRPDAPARSGPSAAVPAGELSMLCIEDNPVNMALVCEVVALRPQIRLSCAETGLQGLEKARRLRPDVVLLDLLLPDLPGLDVLQRLRADPVCAGATVIALSANALPEDARHALAAGFDAYWTKPIDYASFLAGLDDLVRRKVKVPLVHG